MRSPTHALTVGVADRRCAHGLGIGINTKRWADPNTGFAELAGAILANGNTLVVASATPTDDSATAVEFRSPCALNPEFGHNGSVDLTFGSHGVEIDKVLPLPDGGALIAGSTTGKWRWLIGKLTVDGHLDPTFGTDGWSLLRWSYAADELLVTRDSGILIGGYGWDNGSSYVAKLTSDGHIDVTFGHAGRTRMPPWHDGGLQGLWEEPTGDILALVGGGNMGCWGLVAVTLTSRGRRVPGFSTRIRRAVQTAAGPTVSRYPFPAFIGDIVVGSSGFHLIGTSQNGCLFDPPRPNPGEHISNIAFTFDGHLDTTFGRGGFTTLPGPIAAGAWTLPQARGGVLLVTTPAHNALTVPRGQADLVLYRITGAGKLDPAYGHDGVVDFQLPYEIDSDAADLAGPLPVSDGTRTYIITSDTSGRAVVLLRARPSKERRTGLEMAGTGDLTG